MTETNKEDHAAESKDKKSGQRYRDRLRNESKEVRDHPSCSRGRYLRHSHDVRGRPSDVLETRIVPPWLKAKYEQTERRNVPAWLAANSEMNLKDSRQQSSFRERDDHRTRIRSRSPNEFRRWASHFNPKLGIKLVMSCPRKVSSNSFLFSRVMVSPCQALINFSHSRSQVLGMCIYLA